MSKEKSTALTDICMLDCIFFSQIRNAMNTQMIQLDKDMNEYKEKATKYQIEKVQLFLLFLFVLQFQLTCTTFGMWKAGCSNSSCDRPKS